MAALPEPGSSTRAWQLYPSLAALPESGSSTRFWQLYLSLAAQDFFYNPAIQVAIGRRPLLTVFGNDYTNTIDGTCVRDYLHICDLSKAHVNALDFILQTSKTTPHQQTFEIFNIGSGQGKTVLQVIDCFEKTNSVSVKYQLGPRREGDQEISFCDSSKAKTILKWKAEKTLEDMCADTWRFQVQNPLGYRTTTENAEVLVEK